MIKHFSIILVLSFTVAPVFAQEHKEKLFNSDAVLDLKLSMSMDVKDTKGDSVYMAEKLYYKRPDGVFDSIKVGLRARGNFRLKECYFPPLWMKIEKNNAKGTLFEGNKKLKLVLPCNNVKENNDLVLKEYLCYKLYEVLTDYSFQTRLVNIVLAENRKKKTKTFDIKGILIEDVDKVAKRSDAKELGDRRIAPQLLEDTCAFRFDLFQFMISNTDWSKASQHNCKLIYKTQGYIPLPYDFDMSGVVDAPYAVVSEVAGEQLPIQNVRERYFRGYCKPAGVINFVRNEFLSKEQSILAIPDQLKAEMGEKELMAIKDYLSEFFVIIKDDRLFQAQVVSACRTDH